MKNRTLARKAVEIQSADSLHQVLIELKSLVGELKKKYPDLSLSELLKNHFVVLYLDKIAELSQSENVENFAKAYQDVVIRSL